MAFHHIAPAIAEFGSGGGYCRQLFVRQRPMKPPLLKCDELAWLAHTSSRIRATAARQATGRAAGFGTSPAAACILPNQGAHGTRPDNNNSESFGLIQI